MTKTNPVEAYRRQKRKKEIEKNKKLRISARDEIVKQTKTASEIAKQIKELEKRGGIPSHAETMKLQRLKKELKLVAEASKDRISQKPTQPKPPTELDDPRKSVYYDEKMNPFGAPPPGKPRFYHRRGGGTTMNINEAVVPGQEEEARLEQLKEQPQFIHVYRQNAIVEDMNSQQPHNQQRTVPSPPPPRNELRPMEDSRQRQQRSHPPLPPPPPPPPPRTPKQIGQPPPPPSRTNDPPVLPAPSSSVARSRKRKLVADIWASTEEVQYERERGIDLEEGVELVKNEWYYQDSFQNLQGPYQANQMQQWAAAGYFPIHTLVRKGISGKFVPICNVNFEAYLQVLMHEPVPDNSKVKGRIEALRQKNHALVEEEAMQSRIDALREQDQQATDENSIEARIDALRQQYQMKGSDNARVQEPPDENHIDQQITEEGLKSRDTALRHELSIDLSIKGQDSEGEKRLNEHFQDKHNDEEVLSGVKDQQHAGPSRYGDPSNEEPQRDIVETFSSEVPSHYAAVDYESVPPYPVDIDEGPPPYPTDDDSGYPVAEFYPISNEDLRPENLSYPVVGTYPVEADYEGYPVDVFVEANPVPIHIKDHMPNPMADKADEKKPEKTVFKVDQDIVGFMPSHLQKRRVPNKAKSTAPKPAKKVQPAANKSIGDDYDTFMNEISNL